MKRKWLVVGGVAAALVIAAALLCGIVFRRDAAPDEAGPQVPTLRILTIGETESAAVDRVSEALSEITLERLGCRVKLVMMRPSDYEDYIDDLIHNVEPADILVCTGRESLKKLTSGSYIYRLDRYLERYPEFRECIPEEEAWLQTSVGGYCYGIPFGNPTEYAPGFLMRSDICRSLDTPDGEITDLQQLESLLQQVKRRYPELIPVVPHYGQMENFVAYDARGNGVIGALGGGAYRSVIDLDGFRELCETMYDWHEQGLILRNATLSDDSRADWLGSGMAFGSFARLDAYTRRQTEYESGQELTCIRFGSETYSGDSLAKSFCVYAYTQKMDLSLSLLRLIYTDPQVRQLCVYGQEGVDYTERADGAAVPCGSEPEGGRYLSWYWPLLDEIAPPMRREDELAGLERGTAAGASWLFDSGDVSGELYQCSEIMEKYFNALCAGMLDPEEGIAQMRQELQDEGIEAVETAANSQREAANNKT